MNGMIFVHNKKKNLPGKFELKALFVFYSFFPDIKKIKISTKYSGESKDLLYFGIIWQL